MDSRIRVLVLLILALLAPDSTLGQVVKILPTDGAPNDLFGLGVDLDANGMYVLLGARSDDNGADAGSAYVFTRSDTVWTEDDKLFASDAEAGDLFGESVAIDNGANYALVGATGNKDAGFASGSAYVYTRNVTTWAEQTKLLSSDLASGDRFGTAVDLNLDATYAVITAAGDDGPTSFVSGSAYVFTRAGSSWTEQAKLLPSSYSASDQYGFGSAVSMSGDGSYAAVGARRIDGSSGAIIGRTHVFVRTGSSWTEQAVIVPEDSTTASEFGNPSLNADGTFLIIGSNGDGPGFSQIGSAYVYARSGSTWTLQQKLEASDGADFDEFGGSVSIDAGGDRSLISSNGAAYLFVRSGSAWSEEEILATSDSVAVGRPLALSADGEYAVVAARFDTVNGFNSGSAYGFDLSPVVLAVELIDLSAKLDGADVHLNWQTASERDNAGFAIEQWRQRGAGWNSIAWVDGHGTSTRLRSYRHIVPDVAPGRYRFRLVQVDLDGTSTYSPEVELIVPGSGREILRLLGAHPVHDVATVELRSNVSDDVRVAVFDALGRLVTVLRDGPINADMPLVLRWDAGTVASGLYFVRVDGRRTHAARHLVVAR